MYALIQIENSLRRPIVRDSDALLSFEVIQSISKWPRVDYAVRRAQSNRGAATSRINRLRASTLWGGGIIYIPTSEHDPK
jgi:hypothetical protein